MVLISEVQQRYAVGEDFAQAYLDYWAWSTGRHHESLDQILRSPAPWPMWFDFAMSTNLRGRETRDSIIRFLPKNPRRYLDVGCGFGGFLVAFSELGMEVCGLEIDPRRIELGLANCRDHGLREPILEVSIQEDGLRDRLGLFDVITCVDVIEHVEDARKALRNMSQLLSPAGILFLQIPNKDCLAAVASDGHFSLFGITLLERADAILYQGSRFSFDYDVGEYYPLGFYEKSLAEFGCESALLPENRGQRFAWKKFIWMLIAALRGYLRFGLRTQSTVPQTVTRRIHTRFIGYLGTLLAGLMRTIGERGTLEDFKTRYVMDFWMLLARKYR